MSREEEARKNREQFPHIAGVVDEFRREFGSGVKLTYAEENGRVMGKKSNPEDFVVIEPYRPAHAILKRGKSQHG